MLLPTASIFFGLWALWLSPAFTSPVPWSENLPEEINLLRASGMSEADIASRYRRYLSSPSPPDITNATPFPVSSSPPALSSPLCQKQRPSRFRQMIVNLVSKTGLADPADDGDGENSALNEMGMDEDVRFYGTGRLTGSVGRREGDLRRWG